MLSPPGVSLTNLPSNPHHLPSFYNKALYSWSVLDCFNFIAEVIHNNFNLLQTHLSSSDTSRPESGHTCSLNNLKTKIYEILTFHEIDGRIFLKSEIDQILEALKIDNQLLYEILGKSLLKLRNEELLKEYDKEYKNKLMFYRF